jgi:hypothetical protein
VCLSLADFLQDRLLSHYLPSLTACLSHRLNAKGLINKMRLLSGAAPLRSTSQNLMHSTLLVQMINAGKMRYISNIGLQLVNVLKTCVCVQRFNVLSFNEYI